MLRANLPGLFSSSQLGAVTWLATRWPSRRNGRYVGALASVVGVIFLCRNLILGHGGYQLYVDAALPASNLLLRGTCAQSLSLWSPSNLGHRVLYPAEYLFCGPIVGALQLGLPAWVISRLLPVLALCLAALGMFGLTVALLDRLDKKATTRYLSDYGTLAACITGIIYACSPYSFDELVAGHTLYLISLAAVPWAARILLGGRRSLLRIGAAATLLAISYVQVQFFVLAPLALVLVALTIGSRKMLTRSALASAAGIVPHLPWILPLLLYPPSVNIGAYLLPGTDTRFAINPLDSLRLVGYVTPFAESAVRSWYWLWRLFSFGALSIAALGLLKLGRRVILPVSAVLLVALYQWGAASPAYDSWSPAVPWPVEALFRERYALSFITLVLLCFGVLAGVRALVTESKVLAAGATLIALVGIVGPFADGHLGPYGIIREDFSTATAIAQYVDSRSAGAVLTIPFGSIVKASDWPTFGRSPFSIGGPSNVLDSEGDPNAAALPAVQTLARAMNQRGLRNYEFVYEYIHLLDVVYVVEWKSLLGDIGIDQGAISENLARLNAESVWKNSDAILWQIPRVDDRPAVVTSSGVLVSAAIHPGLAAESGAWQVPLIVSQSGRVGDLIAAARQSGEVIHLTSRAIETVRNGSLVVVNEPVFLSQGAGLFEAIENYSMAINSAGAVVFGDGSLIPTGSSRETVTGPVDTVFSGATHLVMSNQPLTAATHNVQDTTNSAGLSLSQAGISAQVIDQSSPDPTVKISAAQDEAGLPVAVPFIAGARYSFQFESQTAFPAGGRVAVVADTGREVLAESALSSTSVWTDTSVQFTAPPTSTDIYLYFYLAASHGPDPASMLIRRFRGTATTATPNALGQSASPTLNHVSPIAQLPGLPEVDVIPSFTEAAQNIDDSRNVHGLSLDQAGIHATLGNDASLGTTLTVEAAKDQAGLPIPIPVVPGGTYDIVLYARHVSGPPARLALVVNGNYSGTQQMLPTSRRWTAVHFQFRAPPDSQTLYTFLYVDAPGREEIAGTHVAANPPFFDAVLLPRAVDCQAPAAPCIVSAAHKAPQWILAQRASGPWWQLHIANASVTGFLADGVGLTWLEPTATDQSPVISYEPEGLFTWTLGALGALFVAVAFVVLAYRLIVQPVGPVGASGSSLARRVSRLANHGPFRKGSAAKAESDDD